MLHCGVPLIVVPSARFSAAGQFWMGWLLAALMALAALAAPPARAAEPADPNRIELFVREGCPHCGEAEAFMARLGRERPELVITIRDVQKEPAAMARLQELVRASGAGVARVPAAWVNGQLILGYSKEASTDRLIRAALAGSRVAHGEVSDASSCEAEDSLSCGPGGATPADDAFSVTLLGRTLTLEDIGLPLFSVTLGLLDGFNPCSMWVLLLMISLLAPLADRKRMLAIAGTFVLVQGIAYFAMMAAWLNLFLFIGLSRISQIAIAAIAIAAGLINLKDVLAFGRGITLSIPEAAKPKIYSRMRGILHAPTYTAAIAGAIVLALLVQVVEFMCTSGFPALFTRILTLRELDTAAYYGYLLLYNAAYMLDDMVVLGIGVTLLSRHRLQEKEGRLLKLVAGVVMIGLGIYLLADG
jgi:glutaredoxin